MPLPSDIRREEIRLGIQLWEDFEDRAAKGESWLTAGGAIDGPKPTLLQRLTLEIAAEIREREWELDREHRS